MSEKLLNISFFVMN